MAFVLPPWTRPRHSAMVRTSWAASDTLIAFERGLPGDWLMFDRRPVSVWPQDIEREPNRFELAIGWPDIQRTIYAVMRAEVVECEGGSEVRCQTELHAFSLLPIVLLTLATLGVATAQLIGSARSGFVELLKATPLSFGLLLVGPLALLVSRMKVWRDHRYLLSFVALAVMGRVVESAA